MRILESEAGSFRWVFVFTLSMLILANGHSAHQLAPSFNVRHYGAVGDGKTLDTKAIQITIDTAADSGGGTVRLSGGTFLSGTLYLRNNVTLSIEAGAILRGSLNIADYPDNTPKINYLYRPRFTKSLIYAERAENIALIGRGTIDGQGEHFHAKPGDDKQRPYILRFSECKNVRVRDVTFRNSARWLSHYLACQNVVIDGITINSRIRENRDGMDIDSCDGVTISNCNIYSGDDAIVLKATAMRPCRRVTITNCIVSSMASALKLGTESNGGFEDVTITNCTVYDTGYSGIGLMTVDGGTLDRVTISNITMTNVKVPIFIRLGNRARPIPGMEPTGVGALRNVIISNVQADGADKMGCSITGIPGHFVENVTLENIRIRFQGGGSREDAERKVPEKERSYPSGRMFGPLPAYGLYCRHVQNLRLHNIDFQFENDDQRPAIVCDDVHNLDLFGLHAKTSLSIDAMRMGTNNR
ncbi:MAG: glycoside hydrolase family 28 protein [Sedimentisphaerales bacterium]|nr:glycoside hydrolase family 28 protein [Sedimentisphaerales bacterium]